MHLLATNVSLWVRTVVWETANQWLHYLHQTSTSGYLANDAVALQLRAHSPATSTVDYTLSDDDLNAPVAKTLSSIAGVYRSFYFTESFTSCLVNSIILSCISFD